MVSSHEASIMVVVVITSPYPSPTNMKNGMVVLIGQKQMI